VGLGLCLGIGFGIYLSCNGFASAVTGGRYLGYTKDQGGFLLLSIFVTLLAALLLLLDGNQFESNKIIL